MTTLSTRDGEDPLIAAQAAAAASNSRAQVPFRPDSTLKPKKNLSPSMSIPERDEWKRYVTTYLTAGINIDSLQADNLCKLNIYLSQCIEDQLMTHLRPQWNDYVKPENNIKRALDHINKNRNINEIRMQLLSIKPYHGELFSEYGERVLYAADQAGIDSISRRELLSLSAFNHYNDDSIKEVIIRQRLEADLRRAVNFVKEEERIKFTLASSKKKNNAVAGLSARDPARSPSNSRTPGNTGQGGRNRKPTACYKCGIIHQQPCKVSNLSCSICPTGAPESNKHNDAAHYLTAVNRGEVTREQLAERRRNRDKSRDRRPRSSSRGRQRPRSRPPRSRERRSPGRNKPRVTIAAAALKGDNGEEDNCPPCQQVIAAISTPADQDIEEKDTTRTV